jgi:aminopeptidase N
LLLIAHEAAHTYFPAQTNGRGIAYIWLSEGFAEYLGLMAVEAVLGRQAFLKELDENRQWYARFAGRDRPLGAYTRVNAGQDGGVRYSKGSFVLHMLRFVVGDEAFRKTLQTYATRFRNRSVRVTDFQSVASEVAGQDLAWFFQEWVMERVLPDYTVGEATSAPTEGGFRTTAMVRNQGTGVMPVVVGFEMDNNERATQRVEVGSRAEVTVAVTTPRPVRRVEVDPEKWILQANYQNDSAPVR